MLICTFVEKIKDNLIVNIVKGESETGVLVDDDNNMMGRNGETHERFIMSHEV